MKTSVIRLRRYSALFATLLILAMVGPFSAYADEAGEYTSFCEVKAPLCTDVADSLDLFGHYVGHDEPSLLFYSNAPGSGNSSVYQLTLPKDPPTLPKQDGTGGTFNFQLHPAFWFGMAMCDTQSAPAPSTVHNCKPDSDENIFDNVNASDPHYIGKHPGTAFMEMQFYPPGFVKWPAGASCDGTQWCAALNIDSVSRDYNTGINNNGACLAQVGIEPVNFAFITKNGKAHGPADPVSTFGTPNSPSITPNRATDLFMNSGDKLVVDMHDTPAGFQVNIRDLTTGRSGSMTASISNGFGQIKYDPSGSGCTVLPYAFHPMYSTASEHTRVPWAVHTYNVAFSDEIGHFEYCSDIPVEGGNCNSPSATDPSGPDGDDDSCFSAASSSRVQIGGCYSFLATDFDFDGPPYQLTWPGTFKNPKTDNKFHPDPILFTSPQFRQSDGHGDDNRSEDRGLNNYSRVAFETDLPALEAGCNVLTGAGCVNPPPGAQFYPIYSTQRGDEDQRCQWQIGGAFIPGTTNTFGGNSNAEYGPILDQVVPRPTGGAHRFFNFRRILNNNPCRSGDN